MQKINFFKLQAPHHTPVLRDESVYALNIKHNGIYIDCTFGEGGHSHFILSKLSPKGHLYAIDRDYQAIIANNIYDPKFTLIHGPFSNLLSYMTERKLIGHIDGIILDLGISSSQIHNAMRGFSFMYDGPLDMRIDHTNPLSAAEWLLTASEDDIILVFKKYGEERFSRIIARAIIKCNHKNPITRTKELANIICKVIQTKKLYSRKHPATRIFQAIRIFINDELTELYKVLKSSLIVLKPTGRLSVITFHSLEDRIVKQFIKNPYHNSMDLNSFNFEDKNYNYFGQFKNIEKIKPSQCEVNVNPCARSAILRTAEKII
ncbi:MAG: 16S rRNA (cytosine(1402)-N(4))-methyltransferase RsmH [Candidatus Dasytiphilus stammeri]